LKFFCESELRLQGLLKYILAFTCYITYYQLFRK